MRSTAWVFNALILLSFLAGATNVVVVLPPSGGASNEFRFANDALRTNNAPLALAILGRLESLHSNETLWKQKAVFLKGDIYLNLNQAKLANDEYYKIANDPLLIPKDQFYFQMGMSHFRLNEKRLALQWWDKLLAEVPKTTLRKQTEFWMAKTASNK